MNWEMGVGLIIGSVAMGFFTSSIVIGFLCFGGILFVIGCIKLILII